MSGIRIGVLAEDATDCNAVGVLIRRIAGEVRGPPVGINKYSGKGCHRLRKGAEPKMKLMADEGCVAAVLVHDLDRDPNNGELNDEAALRAKLEAIELPANLARLICIPVEELEAWFWSDPAVIEEVGRGKGKAHPSPHLIKSPKEELIRLSIGANKRPRYSTNDNDKLAAKLDLGICAQRCASFRLLMEFVRGVVQTAA
jgi:hypothetical protein